jgi:rhodanese-related sulfurtransferase
MHAGVPAEEIAATEAAKLLAENAIVLIDCREPDEYALCSIPGAKLIPLGEWGEKFPHGFPGKDAAIVIHCHHGMRSLRATRWLRHQGYSNARSMAGGIEAWSLQVDPSVPRY